MKNTHSSTAGKRYKFPVEWQEALMILGEAESIRLWEIIREYRETGITPDFDDPFHQMIFLLVKPTIDRRRKASEAARMRRESARRLREEQSRPSTTMLSAPTEAESKDNAVMEFYRIIGDDEADEASGADAPASFPGCQRLP